MTTEELTDEERALIEMWRKTMNPDAYSTVALNLAHRDDLLLQYERRRLLAAHEDKYREKVLDAEISDRNDAIDYRAHCRPINNRSIDLHERDTVAQERIATALERLATAAEKANG